MKTVILKYQECCGCGCDTKIIKREVKDNSSLEDGDTVDDLLSTDIVLFND